jgi:hypothetical protein
MTTKKQTKQRTDCTPCIVCAVRLRLDSQQPTCRLTLRNLLPAHAASMYINTQRPASQQPHPCQTSSPCALCMPQGPTTMHGTASPLSVCATCPRTAITRPGTQQAAIQIRSTMWSHSSCTRATHHFLQAPCLEQLLRYLCATIFQVSHCSLYDLLLTGAWTINCPQKALLCSNCALASTELHTCHSRDRHNCAQADSTEQSRVHREAPQMLMGVHTVHKHTAAPAGSIRDVRDGLST